MLWCRRVCVAQGMSIRLVVVYVFAVDVLVVNSVVAEGGHYIMHISGGPALVVILILCISSPWYL